MKNSFSLSIAVILTGLVAGFAAGPDPTRVREIAGMLPPKPAGFGRPISDRDTWDRLAHHPAFSKVPRAAERLVNEGLPEQPDDLFLDYSRTGNRDRWQKVASARRSRVTTFTLAECVEKQGRFLKPLEETIAALCTEKTWVYPAHDGNLKSFKGETMAMDLGSTALSWELATSDWLLGEKLPLATRKLIRENLERRTFAPIREMLDGKRMEVGWLSTKNNWNAVCLGGLTGAALAILDSPEERAWFAAVAEARIKSFLSGFTPDGYCSEGLGYWNYGFGHFVMLGEALRQATGGKLDLLAQPAARMPAQFALRDEIQNGIYPTIADCSPGSQPDAKLMHYVCERLQIAAPRWKDVDTVDAGRSLCASAMYTFLPATLPPLPNVIATADLGLRTWFEDGGVLICRPAAGGGEFAACLKGGHNAEHHNHNDVGSFSVVCGKTMVLCDPGSEVYTARTFSSRRYESKVLSSFGHSVPVIAGQLQRVGLEARAVVRRAEFSETKDTLELDFRSAYEVPELQRLERQFVYARGEKPSLLIRDDVELAKPASFETALITWSKWKKVSAEELLVGEGREAVRVRMDTGGLAFDVTEEVLHEDVHTSELPRRIAVRLKEPVAKARVSFEIQPGQ